MRLLLNADVGEGICDDQALYAYLDQASIACTGHAGDDNSMRLAVQCCLQHNVMIGAHPSYPDRANFGRTSMRINADELITSINDQINALDRICHELGAKLAYVKPHGALYNDMMKSDAIYSNILNALQAYKKRNSDTGNDHDQPSLALMIGAQSKAEAALGESYQVKAQQKNVPLLTEVFADRLYLDNGQLCPRNQSGAVLTSAQAIVKQASDLANHHHAFTQSGRFIDLHGASLCLHGDNPASLCAAAAVSIMLAGAQAQASPQPLN